MCEKCWFSYPYMGVVDGRLVRPSQVVDPDGLDLEFGKCCLCNTPTITQIWVRIDPMDSRLLCKPEVHP